MNAKKKISPTVNSKKTFKKVALFSAALVIFIAFVALNVVWFVKAGQVKKEVVSSVDNFSLFLKSQQKGEFKVEKISITGYPFAIKVNLNKISLSKELLELNKDLTLEKFSICLPFLSNSLYVKFPKEVSFGENKITNSGAKVKLNLKGFGGNFANIKSALDLQNLQEVSFNIKDVSYIKNNKVFYSADKLELELERKNNYLDFEVDFKNVAQSEEYINKNLFEKLTNSKVVFSDAEKASIASLKEFVLQNNHPFSVSLNGYIPIEAQKLLIEKKDLKVLFNLHTLSGKVETKVNLKAKSSKLSSLDEVQLSANVTNFKKALTFIQNSYNLVIGSNLNKVIQALSTTDVSTSKFEYKTTAITDEYVKNITEALTALSLYNEKTDLVKIDYKKDAKQETLNGKKFADLKPVLDEKLKAISEKSKLIEIVEKKPAAKTRAKKVSK